MNGAASGYRGSPGKSLDYVVQRLQNTYDENRHNEEVELLDQFACINFTKHK